MNHPPREFHSRRTAQAAQSQRPFGSSAISTTCRTLRRHSVVAAPASSAQSRIAWNERSLQPRPCAPTAFPPLLLDLEAEHDTDHFSRFLPESKALGSVGDSIHGIPFRDPVYRSLRGADHEFFQFSIFQPAGGSVPAYLLPAGKPGPSTISTETTEKPVWFVVDPLL